MFDTMTTITTTSKIAAITQQSNNKIDKKND